MSKLKELVLQAEQLTAENETSTTAEKPMSPEFVKSILDPLITQYGSEKAHSILRAGIGFMEEVDRADKETRDREALEVRKRFITDYVAPRLYQPSVIGQKVTCAHIVSAGNGQYTDHMYLSATDNEIRVAECKSDGKLTAEKMGHVFGAFKTLVRDTKAHSGRAIVASDKVENRKLNLETTGEGK